MGQQQIFLLIVVFIIVTIAVIVALNLGSEVQVQFMEDEYSQMMMETAVLMQATYEKPELFSGGNHDWAKVNFNNVPCSFGVVFDTKGRICRSEDGTLIILLGSHGEYLSMMAMAHIAGKDMHHMYSREMRVHPDSVVFNTDWISHQ